MRRFGVGRFGIGPFGGAAVGQEKLVSAVLDADRRHAEDAIIAASAGHAGMLLATGDDRLAKRARSEGLAVLMTDEVFALVGFDWATARQVAGLSMPRWWTRKLAHGN